MHFDWLSTKGRHVTFKISNFRGGQGDVTVTTEQFGEPFCVNLSHTFGEFPPLKHQRVYCIQIYKQSYFIVRFLCLMGGTCFNTCMYEVVSLSIYTLAV